MIARVGMKLRRRTVAGAARLVVPVALAASLLGLLVCCTKPNPKPNIVLIVVDALRPDFLGCYGYDRPTSPNIDKLAARGILFETAIAHASWTKPSFATLLTSLYPFQHGVVDWESVMPDTVTTLPEVLRAHGYATMGIITMLGLTGEYQVIRGIDTLFEAPKHELNAMETTAIADSLIENSKKPFFLLIHYHDAHWPYKPSTEYVDPVRREGDGNPFASLGVAYRSDSGIPTQDAIDRERLLYSACVRQADDGIGRLVESLRRAGLIESTVLVVTADHGEAFWEHKTRAHGFNLYDEAIRVPLIIHYPARFKKAARLSPQVGLVDVMPTVTELAGASDPAYREGLSLLRLVEPRRAEIAGGFFPRGVGISELDLRRVPGVKSLRTLDWKLIVEPSTSMKELYSLNDDPGETINLWQNGGRIGDSLQSLISKVPGSSLSGWRIAVTGSAGDASITLKGKLGRGARLLRLNKVTGGGTPEVVVAPDSTSFSLEARSRGLYLLLFDVVPRDAEVSLKILPRGKDAPAEAHVGLERTTPVPATLALRAQACQGLPGAFQEFRTAGRSGIFVWWLPGEEWRESGKRATLSPEQKKRLRALGYAQ
jgi:arylsulfatase A-like enzyme